MNDAVNWPLVVFVVLWLAGLVGTFIPVVPAVWIILGGALLSAFLDGFAKLSWPWLVLVALLGVGSIVLDNLASAWGARRYGGSRAGVWGAFLGGIAGIFIFPPWGLLLGPLAGALLGEVLFMRRSLREGLRSSWGTLVGMLLGVAGKLALHLAMGALVIWRLA